MVFTLAAAMTGMGPQGTAQLGDLSFLLRKRRAAAKAVVPAAVGCRGPVVTDCVACGGSELPAGLGYFGVEGLRDPDAGDGRNRSLEVVNSDPSQLVVHGQHRRPWFAGRVVRTQHHGESRSPTRGYVNDIAGKK